MRIARFILILSLGTLVAAQQEVRIDANGPTSPFLHFWEEMFGSGRAILTLRDSYLKDLDAVKAVTDFRYVRFHAILHDEVGVRSEEHTSELQSLRHLVCRL